MAHSCLGWFQPQLVVDDDRFVVAGEYYFVLFRYLTRGGGNRPYASTLTGPSGRNLLEQSAGDHIHHEALWWGHGDVNGVDYYLELPGGEVTERRGTMQHVRWLDLVDDAPRFGFVEEVAWRDDTGAPVIDERRAVTYELVSPELATLDLDSTYTAVVDLTFGDTKEAVLPGFRIAEALTGAVGGTIRNARGQTTEAECFGQPAEWVDVSGPRTQWMLGEQLTEGLAILDHPENPGHPTRWFTRDYGPISPFPGHHFHADRTLAAGASLRLRHRALVHLGGPDEAGVADHHAAWART